MFGFSDDLFVSIIFVDRVHATALVLPTNFVAWASPANHSRFQVTCPLIIFVGRTHVTDTESAKTDRKFKYERSSETYIGFSDDLFASIIFVGRVHATALVLSTNFVAWASPASHLRFQTTCPLIIFVGRTHATDTVPVKTDRKFKHKRSSETLISSFRRPFLHLPASVISDFTSVRFVPPAV